MEEIEDLEEFLNAATNENARGKLRDRGIAWSLMRVNGSYDGTTEFSATIDTDLFEFGLSIVRASLELKDRKGNKELVNKGFETAGRTFESLLTNRRAEDPESGFIQIIAACCYHLAGFSAIAFSILNNQVALNINQAENSLRLLILRNLSALRGFVSRQLAEPTASDEFLSKALSSEELTSDEVVVKIVNLSICRSIAFFEFALQTGEVAHVETAKSLLTSVIRITSRGAYVTLWWIARLTLHLLDDL